MSKTLANLEHQKLSLLTTNRYVLHFDPLGAGYTTDRTPALNRQIQDRFQALPGVASVCLVAGHLMASQLYGVAGYDPLALAGSTLVLGLCASAVGFIPARRASTIEPMQALRTK